MGSYGRRRDQVDEWAYETSRKLAVAAVGIVLAGTVAACLSVLAGIVWAIWGAMI